VADQRLVLGAHVLNSIDRFLGHDQNVGWSAGVDVAKGEALLVLVDDVRRKLSIDNLGEDGLLGHGRVLMSWADSRGKTLLSAAACERLLDESFGLLASAEEVFEQRQLSLGSE
jgi:hypothetical protein